MQNVASYKYHPGTSPRVCSCVVGSLLIARWALGRVGEHTSLYWQYSTLQAAAPTVRGISSRARSPPTTFHSVYCALESAQPRPEVWSARWCAIPTYRVQRTCNELVINALVELEQKLCLCCSWAGTSSTLVSWRTLGRCPSFHGGPLGEFGRS